MSDNLAPQSRMYGKEGMGHYGNTAKTSYHVNNGNIPLALAAIKAIPYDSGRPFTLIEYGAADGGPSAELFREIVREIKRLHGQNTPISIIYEDQPSSDFKSLFYRIQGLLPGIPKVFDPQQMVHVYASGTSFYEQCCHQSGLDFGYSAVANHWLSKFPCHLTDTIQVHLATNQEEVRLFEMQAAQDWDKFLELRATELRPGGRCIIMPLARDHDGQFTSHVSHVPCCTFTTLTELWKEMADEGAISQEEFQKATMNAYYRSEEELCAPLRDVTSGAYKLGLRLVKCDVTVLRNPFRQNLLDLGDSVNEDAGREYAKSFTSAIRLWSNSTFCAGLTTNRPSKERDRLAEELYTRMENQVARNPTHYSDELVVGTLLLAKCID